MIHLLSFAASNTSFFDSFPAWMTQKGTKTTKKRVTIYNPEYGLEEFQELWSNREAFFAFMQHFLKQCYIRKWTTKLSNAIKISSILTVSDEAFVLLILGKELG